MTHQDMNTPTSDYGEPWKVGRIDRPMEDRHGHDPLMLHRTRVVACVNACAGMADPAAEIAMLKQVGAANARLHLEAVDAAAEIAAMREAIAAADKAIRILNHEGMCFCDAQYATNAGSHPRHSNECIQANAALAKLQPFIQ